MARELEDQYPDVYPAAQNPPCPQQLHYYNERRHPRFDRGDMGPVYYPHESWSALGRPYFPRPEFEYGPGPPPFITGGYGRGVDYRPHRNDYRRRDMEQRDDVRDGSMEREHVERKRRHHKSSKHRHRRSRHHHRHKRLKHSEMNSEDERGNGLPSLTLGAEISRGRRHAARTSVLPESDISEDGSESYGEPSDNVGASVTLSPSSSSVPVAYSSYDIENDKGEAVEPAASLEDKQQNTEESDDGPSSDAESSSKKSQSSTSSSDGESGSPTTATKHKTKQPQVTKFRSSYATALAAKLRQNRLALEERSCRRPDTSTSRLQPTEGSPSVIDKCSVNAEASRFCSDSNLISDNSSYVDQAVTANKWPETSGSSSAVICSPTIRAKSSTQISAALSALHREVSSTANLNWQVVKICVFISWH